MKPRDKQAIEESARAAYADDRPARHHADRHADAASVEGDLEWYFNYAAGSLGLSSSWETLVAISKSGGNAGSPSSDGGERKIERALDDSKRFRAISDVLHRLSKRIQLDIFRAFNDRKWPPEIGKRVRFQRGLAATSATIREHMGRRWKLDGAVDLLATMEREANGPQWTALRVATWNEAEKRLDEIVAAFADARAERDADERARRALRGAARLAQARARNAS